MDNIQDLVEAYLANITQDQFDALIATKTLHIPKASPSLHGSVYIIGYKDLMIFNKFIYRTICAFMSTEETTKFIDSFELKVTILTRKEGELTDIDGEDKLNIMQQKVLLDIFLNSKELYPKEVHSDLVTVPTLTTIPTDSVRKVYGHTFNDEEYFSSPNVYEDGQYYLLVLPKLKEG